MPQNTAELAEICEPLHINEETASRLLEETVSKRCAGGLLQAAALLRQNKQSDAIEVPFIREVSRAGKDATTLIGPRLRRSLRVCSSLLDLLQTWAK